MGSHSNNQNAPDIFTSYPGHITNFDENYQTCTVTLAIENLFIGYRNAYTLQPNQVLENVPVKFTQGGGWSLTHPVPDGTPCCVNFSQRGIDHWLTENSSSAGLVEGLPAPAFGQLFSHNAATCTVGTQPIPLAIENFQGDVFEMRNADRSQRHTFHDSGLVEIVTGAASIKITKNTEIEIDVTSKATIKAPQIMLDGDTTVTKSLTVLGGMSVVGGTGATSTITGDFVIIGNTTQTGSMTLNGVQVDGHDHVGNGAGNDTGPMK